MSELIIFPNSAEFPNPIYPLLAYFGCITIFIGLYEFNVQKIITSVFQLSIGMGSVFRTIIYLLLINFPIIVLSSCSLVFSHNLIGLLISSDMDQIQIILLSGYICYLQESRQTPIRGFLFGRDLFTLIAFLGVISNFYYDGKVKLEYGIIILCLFLIYLGFQNFQQILEDKILKFVGVKESNVYNSTYLLTQTHKEANYLQIHNIVIENQAKIKVQVEEFKETLDKLFSSQDQKLIMLNFAKIFIPYKVALEVDEDKQIQMNLKRVYDDWFQHSHEGSISQTVKSESQVQITQIDKAQGKEEEKIQQTGDYLVYQRTMTDDYVLQDQAKLEQESTWSKFSKIIFYPLYLISKTQDRIRFFLDLFCVIMLAGSMFILSACCSYFFDISKQVGYTFISLPTAALLLIPTTKYYLHLSTIKDFDFVNIFLQSFVIKSAVFSIFSIVTYIINNETNAKGSLGLLFSLLVNIVTYILFAIFMISQKFATLKSNFNFFFWLTIASFTLKIGGQIICNVIIAKLI